MFYICVRCIHVHPGVSAVVTTVNALLPVVPISRFPRQHTSIHIRLPCHFAFMVMPYVYPAIYNDTINIKHYDNHVYACATRFLVYTFSTRHAFLRLTKVCSKT